MLGLGASFQLKDFQTGDWTHIWIVATTPVGADGNALILNVTTLQPGTQDRSCILKKGDHPSIIDDSVINYGESGRPQVPALASMQENPNIRTFPAISEDVLARIHDGALKSPHLEPKFLKMVSEELKRS